MRRFAGVAVLLLAAGCGSKTAEQWLAEARAQTQARDYKSAVITAKSALEADANSAEARALLGTALLESHDAAGAVVELRKAFEAGHDRDRIAPLLARALLTVGDARSVVKTFANTTLGAPRAQAELATLLSLAYEEQQDGASAATALAAARKADAGYPRAALLHARRLAEQGSWDEATALVDQVLAADARSIEGLMLRGDMLAERGAFAQAAQAFDAVLQVEPKHLLALGARVRLALQARQADEARARLDAMRQAWPNDPQTTALAVRVALAQGRIDEAREAAARLVKDRPADVQALYWSAMVERQAGATLLAQDLLRKARSYAPSVLPIQLMLARVQIESGDGAAALATLEPLIERDRVPTQALSLAAQAHLLAGRHAQAEALFARMAAASSAGAPAAGEAVLSQWAEADRSGTGALTLLAQRWMRGDLAGALLACQRAQAEQPANAQLEVIRARLLAQMGRRSEARAALEQALSKDKHHFGAAEALAQFDAIDGRGAAAVARLERFAAEHPGDARPLLALARWQQRSGEPRQTIEATLRRAIQARAEDPLPTLELVRFQLASGQAAAALATARSAASTFPREASVRAALGQAQLAAGESEQALVTLRALARERLNDAWPRLRLAQALRATRQTALAREAAREALQIEPGLAAARQMLVEMAMDERQWPLALQLAREQQQRAPTGSDGWMWEAAVHVAQQQWDAAVATLKTALDHGGGAVAAGRLHAVWVAAGRPQEADRLLREWARQNPRDTALLIEVADAAAARRDWATAERRYRDVLALAPRHAGALNNLAWCLLEQGKPGAAALARQASEIEPGNVNLLDTLGAALLAERQPAQAVEVLQKAVSGAPERAPLRLALARAALQKGDKALARDELDKLQSQGDAAVRAQALELMNAAR